MQKKKYAFNMIEIVLALGIIAIGITGVLGILPVAVTSSKAAVGDSYAADAANTFLSYIEATVRDNWSNLPNQPTAGAYHKMDPESLSSPITPEGGIEIFDLGGGGYAVRIKDGDVSVFAAEIRIQTSDITDFAIGTSTGTIPNTMAKRVAVEVSWPLNAPDENREKRVFIREFFSNY